MIDCPDCGNSFGGSKCACGYAPPKATSSEINASARLAREAYRIEHERKCKEFDAMQQVVSSVEQVGPKKWAYEIIALRKAGMYQSDYGVRCAMAALNIKSVVAV